MSADLLVVPVSVDPDTLDAAASGLATVAGDLALVGAELATLAANPFLLASVAVSPISGLRAERALGELLFGSSGGVALAAHPLALSVQLRTVSLRYRVGEAATAAVLDLARRAAAEVLVQAAPTLAAVAATAVAADVAYRLQEATDRVLSSALDQVTTTGAIDLDALERSAVTEFGAVDDRVSGDLRQVATFLAAHPGLVQELAASTPYVLDAVVERVPELGLGLQVLAPDSVGADGRVDGVAGVAGALTSLGTLTPLFRETAVRVQPLQQPRAVPTRPPNGIAEVLDGVAHQSTGYTRAHGSVGGRLSTADEPPEGVVRLELVTHADGTRAWIVEIPGTQDWSPLPAGTGTPMDLTTNLRAVAGEDTATAQAVVQAMRAAAVAPGEPVMLAGHSQGGLTAAALAADPEVRAEFSITHVLTAGSPIDSIAVPTDVRVLSLEHTDDVVPALDGEAARSSPHRTLVRRDIGAVPEFAADVADDPLTAHGWNGYLDTAGAVDASKDTALLAYRDSGSAFFDAPGASVEAFDYRAVRVP